MSFSHHGRNTMRILMVSDNYYPYPGGIAEHIHHASLELRELGHEVKILTASYGDNRSFGSPQVIRVGRGVVIPVNRSFCLVPVGWRLSERVRQVLREGDFDIVHTHGPLAPVLPMLAIKHSKAVNIATFHAAHSSSLGYKIFSPILRHYFDKLSGLIAVSEVAKESMDRYFPGDYRIIPNGIDIKRFNPDLEPIETYADGRPNILFVGRFDPRKGLKYLLMAMPRILKSVPEARLLVVGKGFLESYYRRFLDAEFRESVVFVGYVEPELLPRYYTTCDVFCSPATGAESFGIILLEAMAAGTPLVASGIDGYRRVISHMDDGILVPPTDSEALADGIVKLLSDRSLRMKFRENGLKKAEFYSWERVTKTIEQYYVEVIERVSRK
ncbi:glycosyltransferase family 1 protein [candidate division TA06 bacterium]|uniref:Glycosyltransferase family 1 protein n=1 Tax=candidate division TA06 bacterium TaxID=2250710 RepID=A0A523UN52_UNCT6|nr:MAG: glycosyltransferase family 1 protein [candidate division TA06 bacterium]